MINIPKWEDAAEAVKSETASPLDLFVYHNEPAGNPQDVEFRNKLQALLEYVSGLTQRALDGATCPAHGEPVSNLIHFACGCSQEPPRQ